MPTTYELRFTALISALPTVDLAGALEARAASIALLAQLQRERQGAVNLDADVPALERIRDKLQNTHGAITLAELAKIGSMGRTRLCAAFRKRYGMPPLSYLRHVRLERAKHDLAVAGLPVKVAANRAGFSSVHHFTRAFTRVIGVPPGAFQRRSLVGNRPVADVRA